MTGDLTLKQALDEYKDIYLAYRNYAPRTREEYTNDLEDLIEYLDRVGIHKVQDVRLSNLIRYMAELDHRGLLGSTRKRKVVTIKSFFSYLFSENYTHTNIARELIPPFVEEHTPRYLTTDECSRLLEAAKGNKRDYAIIQMLLQTGMRLSELTRLEYTDIQIASGEHQNQETRGYVRIMASGRKKERTVPLSMDGITALSDFRKETGTTNHAKMFTNRFGNQLGERGVEKIIAKYLVLSGITNASVNSIRHTFGTQAVLKGNEKKSVQKLMGLTDTRSANVYFRLVNDVGQY